jgi:2-amino-4-ketopentanoate thiolase alpha subunit
MTKESKHMIEKNTFVQIYKVVLSSSERSSNLPDDTKRLPFEMRVKGKLMSKASIGDVVEIKTATNRVEQGILLSVEPFFTHTFGHHVQALKDIRDIILSEMEDVTHE